MAMFSTQDMDMDAERSGWSVAVPAVVRSTAWGRINTPNTQSLSISEVNRLIDCAQTESLADILGLIMLLHPPVYYSLLASLWATLAVVDWGLVFAHLILRSALRVVHF